MSAARFLLPSARAAQGWNMTIANAVQGPRCQGWKIKSRVGPSHVLGAGNGRFALDDVEATRRIRPAGVDDSPMRTRTCLAVKPYVQMSQIGSLSMVPGDHTITFKNANDIEKYISLCKHEGGHSRERVLQELSNFVWGYDGKHACLNQSSWTVNHASDFDQGLNCEIAERRLDDGRHAIVVDAVADICKNDELYMDYRRFVLPEFYLAFCKANNIKDVRTLVMEAIGE